jgi:chromate reductase
MNTNKIKILGIAGSLRKNSLNKSLLEAAIELQPDNMNIEMFDISEIPIYNEDIRVLGEPEPVKLFKQKIAESDALLIATPEYNYSIPGVLKNAIDWASRPPTDSPLNGKPLAIMGAGGRMGTVRAQNHLRQVAVYTNMLAMNKPEVLVANAREKFDKEGKLIDERTRTQLRKLLDAFVDWIMLLNKRSLVSVN